MKMTQTCRNTGIANTQVFLLKLSRGSGEDNTNLPYTGLTNNVGAFGGSGEDDTNLPYTGLANTVGAFGGNGEDDTNLP